MRYYAGFLEMAKVYRGTARQGDALPDVPITEDQRKDFAIHVHELAKADDVVDAGARFGWWARKRDDRPHQEIVEVGIPDELKQIYLAEYYETLEQPEAVGV
jgi:hypothetical protein